MTTKPYDTMTARLGWVVGFAGMLAAALFFGSTMRSMYITHTMPADVGNLLFATVIIWAPFRAVQYVLSGR